MTLTETVIVVLLAEGTTNNGVTFQQAKDECETSGSSLLSGVDENEQVAMVTKMKESGLETVWLSLRLERRGWHWINKTTGDCT